VCNHRGIPGVLGSWGAGWGEREWCVDTGLSR
jgi:hypothetical protein